jgi:hypothetical protein
MGSSPDFPKPTKHERALQTEQTDLLRQQREILTEQLRRQDLLAPILYKEAGLAPQYDAAGKVVGFTELPDTDTLKDLRTDIEKRFLERTQAALKGELPTDPGLLRELDEGEQRLHETLRQNLGSGYATSSPGIEAMADFTKRRSEILDAARRGDLTLAEQLGQARGASNLAQTAGRMESLVGGVGAPFQRSSDLGRLASLYDAPRQLGLAQRQSQFQADYQQFMNSPLNRFVYNPTEMFLMSSAQSAGKMAGTGGMGILMG